MKISLYFKTVAKVLRNKKNSTFSTPSRFKVNTDKSIYENLVKFISIISKSNGASDKLKHLQGKERRVAP